MTIDEEAFNKAIMAASPFGFVSTTQLRKAFEAYEQAKLHDHSEDMLDMVSPANTAVLVGATCRCGAKMMVSENFKPDTVLVNKLVEALEFADKNLYEINPSNYDHDEVCHLNSKSVEVALAIMPALTEAQAWLERQGKCGEGWQPIETAPKDGIRYLGMIVGDRFYGEPFVCHYDEDEGHICLHQTEARLHRPTHWMHFPKPPTTSQQEARE